MTINWESLFLSRILERGFEYYEEGSVEDLELRDQVVKAQVCGSEIYEVEINLKADKVETMYCSCPYAESGNSCKHMAAVLYALDDLLEELEEDEEDDVFENSYDGDMSSSHAKAFTPSVSDLVSKADESLVKKFLEDILKENEHLALRFKRLIQPEISKADVARYKQEVDEIVWRYQGEIGFIDFRSAALFIADLEDIFDDDVDIMIEKGQYEQAFELTNYIFLTAAKIEIDDSEREIEIIAENCYSRWTEILRNCNLETKKNMYAWFENHLNGSVVDDMQAYIEGVLIDGFREKNFDVARLKLTEEKVQEAKNSQVGWSKMYNAGKWAIRHLEVMEDHKSNRSEFEAYCKTHWDLSDIRQYYIKKCIAEKDYDRAIEVLKESMQMDRNYAGLIREYSEKLKEIYRQTGRQADYVAQLWTLILKDNAGNIEVYRELKRQYTGEAWVEQREKIFEGLSKRFALDIFYDEEKLYDRLLEVAIQSPGLYTLQRYHNVLKKDFPNQMLEKYEIEVRRMVRQTSNRKHYREVVTLLKKMRQLEGGVDKTNLLITQWRTQYRNRPAMMDELNRF